MVKSLPAVLETRVRSLGWEDPLETSSAAAAAKSLQSCLTQCHPIDGSPPGSPVPGILHLCDPVDCSPLGFSVHGILQARTLEWVAISFSNA